MASYDDRTEVITRLRDSRGYLAEHCLVWYFDGKSVETYTRFTNFSREDTKLEMLSSFSLSGITPLTEGDAHGTLKVHRIRSVWSMEGRLETRTVEELQLEPSWGRSCGPFRAFRTGGLHGGKSLFPLSCSRGYQK